MSDFKAVHFIWDFDGTIIDTYPRSTAILVETMREVGVEIDYDEIIVMLRDSFGRTRKYLNMSDELFDIFLKRACTLKEPHPEPYKEIIKVLTEIKKAGGKNFLYTHRDKSALEYLELYNMLPLFEECITTESDCFALKPAPDVIKHLCKKHSLEKCETAMVGDREIDVLSGKNAGCLAVLFDERNIYNSTCADKKVLNLSEILEFIKK